MRVTRAVLLAVFLLLASGWASIVLALDPQKAVTQYSHQVWQDKDGLPQNSILVITQTRDGYLWLGTEEGLARFDGVRFTVFDKKNTKEIRHNYIAALCEGRDGSLWIGSRGGGLIRYKNSRFTSYTKEDGLAHNAVRAIYEDRDGSLWIGTSNGLNRFKDGAFITYTKKEGLPRNSVLAIYKDREGRLWIGTPGGLSYFIDGQFHSLDANRFPQYTVRALQGDRDGHLWIGTEGSGLYRLTGGTLSRFTTREGLSSNFIRAIYEDRDGNLWIGTSEGGLNRFNPAEGKFSIFTIQHGLSGNIVRSIYEDREGSLWVGTEGGGLNRFKNGKVITYTAKDGLSNDFIRAIRQDRAGTMWIGTEGGGLNRWKDGSFTTYTTREGLLSNFVTSIYEDHDGTLWIGTEDGGLNCLRQGRLTIHPATAGHRQSVWAILQDRQGTLWFGTESGLHRWKDGKLTSFTVSDGLPSNFVKAIHEDPEGYLWIGVRDGYLSRMREGRIQVFTPRDGMPVANVSAFHEDRDGVLWIATDSGLVRWKQGQFTTYTTRDGLFSDNLYQILEDDGGRLWLTSSKGIFYIRKHQLADDPRGPVASVAYTTADGMKSSECTGDAQPAGWKARDGKLWFPTVKGVVVIDPENVPINSLAPPVLIEQVVVDLEPIPLDQDARLPPGTRELVFHYTALSFLAPERVRFKYRLDGLENDWIDAGTRRAAYYTSLPPGRYQFRVMACNNDGVWNEAGASFAFELRPHFYQTYWAVALLAVGVLLSGLGMHRLHIKRMKREFSAVLAERNRMAREIHDTLLQGFAGTALQLDAISHVILDAPETAKEKLIRVLNQIDRCLTEARRSIWDLRSARLENCDLATAITNAAQQLAAGTPVQSHVRVSGTPRRLSSVVETNLLRIAEEAVTNAIKYAQADQILIDLHFGPCQVRLKVQDNGCGFEGAPATPSQGEHLGLIGMRERAELIGGHLSVQSRPSEGTEIMVIAPTREWRFGLGFIRNLVMGAPNEKESSDSHYVRR